MSSLENKRYKLLPFKFLRLNNKELVVNEVGDYLFLPDGMINKIVSGEIQRDSSLYKDLLSKYIICENYGSSLINILSTRLHTKKAFLDEFTTLHIFVLTVRCNERCIYCQASSTDKLAKHKNMSIEDLDNSISLMLQSPAQNLTMEFQGGESSLVPELIKHATKKVKELNKIIGKDIKFVLCTNLYQMTDELLAICLENDIFISTSLDGPEYLHDNNRGIKGAYQHFIEGLSKSRKALGHHKISPLMTTSWESLNYPIEIIDEYRSLGFKNIFLRPLNPYGRAKEGNWDDYYKSFISFYKKCLLYILDLNLSGIYFREDFTAMIMKKILSPFPIGFVDLQSPAGIINSVIVYNYDGYVYCSDESRMMAEEGNDYFKLGKVSDEYKSIFYGKKAQMLSQLWGTEFIAGCSDCAYFQYCGADPVRNYSTQKDPYGYRPSSLFCKLHRQVFDFLLSLIDMEGDKYLPIFRKWVYER